MKPEVGPYKTYSQRGMLRQEAQLSLRNRTSTLSVESGEMLHKMFDGLHLKRPATGECPSWSFKVTATKKTLRRSQVRGKAVDNGLSDADSIARSFCRNTPPSDGVGRRSAVTPRQAMDDLA